MPGLIGGAIPELEAAMRFRVARQSALAANVANADTPGYRRVDLEFDRHLASAAQRLARTDPRHLRSGGGSPYRMVRGAPGGRPDRNGVQLGRELILLSRNAGAFQDQAALVARLLVLRRIAATGEAR